MEIVSGTDLTDDLGIPDNEGSFINPGALDSNQDVYFCNAGNAILELLQVLKEVELQRLF